LSIALQSLSCAQFSKRIVILSEAKDLLFGIDPGMRRQNRLRTFFTQPQNTVQATIDLQLSI
jgi:hypothetical protein